MTFAPLASHLGDHSFAHPLISVVVPTVGRSEEVDALLASLERSTYAPHEVILVDQNGPEASQALAEITGRHPRLNVRHLKVCLRGAARARNYGVRHATGDVLCFPDDDCELFPETIETAVRTMRAQRCEVVFGRAMDRNREDAVARFDREAGYLTRSHHEGRFTEFTMFMRRELFERFPYDETFGIGTFYGSEEAHDLVLRLIDADIPVYYSPEIAFFHPIKVTGHRESAEVRRVFTYRCGLSHLCLKHRLYGKLASRTLKVALYLVYLLLFDRSKARYYAAELLGLLTGLIVR